jgi:hypothetical protein
MSGNYSYATKPSKTKSLKEMDGNPLVAGLGGFAEDIVGLAHGGTNLLTGATEGAYEMFQGQPLDTSGFRNKVNNIADFFDVRQFDYVNRSMNEYPNVAAVAPYVVPINAARKSLMKAGNAITKIPKVSPELEDTYRWFEVENGRRIKKNGTPTDIGKMALKRSVAPAALIGAMTLTQDEVSDFE